MHCLVIGNGESRRGINLNNFKENFTIIGCNAVHRELAVDHLICCDRRMVEESVKSNNTVNTKIYVRQEWHRYFRKIQKDKRINLVPDIPYSILNKQDEPINWGSGPYAVLLAAALGAKHISLVGFDLYGVNNKLNNLYKGTSNYSDKNSKPIDPSYWIHQIAKVFTTFPKTEFYVYNKPNWNFPKRWDKPNVHFETFRLIKNLTFSK